MSVFAQRTLYSAVFVHTRIEHCIWNWIEPTGSHYIETQQDRETKSMCEMYINGMLDVVHWPYFSFWFVLKLVSIFSFVFHSLSLGYQIPFIFLYVFALFFSLISFHSPLRLHRIKTHRNSFISYTCLLLLDVIYWMNLSSRALSFITFLMMSCFFMDSLQFHHKFPEHYLHLCHSIIIFPHFSLIIVFFFLEPILSLSLSFCICVVFLLDLL